MLLKTMRGVLVGTALSVFLLVLIGEGHGQPDASKGSSETTITGTLNLGSKPRCEIFVDGSSTKLSTPQLEMRLSPGTHKVTLVNDEFGIKESFDVVIKSGEAAKVLKDYSDRIPAPSVPVAERRPPATFRPVNPSVERDAPRYKACSPMTSAASGAACVCAKTPQAEQSDCIRREQRFIANYILCNDKKGVEYGTCICRELELVPSNELESCARAQGAHRDASQAAFRAMAPPPPCATITPKPIGRMAPGTHAAVLVTNLLWPSGSTLRVRFLGGTASFQKRVVETSSSWSQYANIKFEQVAAEPSDIRISFDPATGNWSHLGMGAKSVGAADATMNLGSIGDASDAREVSRVVLHEFGHALGMHHEHQSPDSPVRFDEEKTYAYFQRTQGWSREKIKAALFDRINDAETNFTAFDPKSIMIYDFPAELTLDGYSVKPNYELSDLDKSFMARAYSKPSPGCWVETFVDTGYSGTSRKLVGPESFANMRIDGIDWGDKLSSLRVGPEATVDAWEDEGFKDTRFTFLAGQQVPALGAFNFDNEIDSLRVSCAPVTAVAKPSVSTNTCWVKIFEDEKFSTGDAHTKIQGPTKLRNLGALNGKDWGDDIDSLIVGPSARLQVWEDENFEDKTHTFPPGTEVDKLKEIGFGDNIDSLEITCQ